jgi:hypothetical protein
MAYLDGELSEDACAHVEAWLAEDSAARAELDAQRLLREAFEETAPDEPDAESWARALAGIGAALEKAPPALRSRFAWYAAGWVTAAAVLIAAAWIGASRLAGPGPRPDIPVAEGADSESLEVVSEQDVAIDDMDPLDVRCLARGKVPAGLPAELLAGAPFEVACDEEVEVIAMDGGDVSALVVCEPPVAGPLDMARRGEIRVDRIEPMRKGKGQPAPFLHDKSASGMPMLMFPVKTARSN